MRGTLTIATAAAHQRLTTPAFVKQTIETDEIDGVIDAWIATASAIVAGLCNFPNAAFDPYPLARQSYVETFRLSAAQPFLALSRKPLASVTSIECDAVAVDAALFEARPEGLVERLSGGRFSCWTAGVLVVRYDAGFVLSGAGRNVPLALELAATRLIATMVAAESGCLDPAVKSESFVGLGSIDYVRGAIAAKGGVPEDVLNLVAPYAISYPA